MGVAAGSPSMRRILLSVALVLLVLMDASIVYRAVQYIVVGREFQALGVGSIGAGLAVALVPILLVALWLTVLVWRGLRS